jgi:predicted TIM-barrel fold metal-dependent hydrolase
MIIDCHVHVLGDTANYPASATRAYTPTAKRLADYLAQAAGGEPRGVVLVQPSCYGTDNACMLDALATATIPAVGIAVVDDTIADDRLTALRERGIRGLRINLVTEGATDRRAGASVVARRATQAASAGLHIELNVPIDWIGEMVEVVRAAGAVAVVDHMGTPAPRDGSSFAELVDLVAKGQCWVKLSGFDHISHGAVPEVAPFISALVAANEQFCVWGSDWPHLGPHGNARGESAANVRFRDVSEAALLAVLSRATDNPATLDRILRGNPASLYGFEGGSPDATNAGAPQ